MASRLPALEPAAEAALLAEVRRPAGRDVAFRALFEAYRAPVLALCLHLTGTSADAEDATQEIFLAVHSALPRFRGESRLTTWIYRIALRTALRTRARRRPSEPLDPELPGAGGEEAMGARLDARRLAAALARLPAEQRAVLSLFALEGLGHREIADILGVPEGTVWSRLHGARKRLAAELGGEG
jgi:RNA polymerase sigma-70 factor, ECF subfamily